MTTFTDAEKPNFGTTTKIDAKFSEIPEEIDDDTPDRPDPDDEAPIQEDWKYQDDRDLDYIPKR